MKINRKELLDVLKKLKPAISKTEIVEQTTDFIFMKDKIYTFNNEIAIGCVFDIGLTGSVIANKFLSIIEKLKEDIIDISIKDEKEIIIKSGKTKAGIKYNSDIHIQIPNDIGNKKFKILPKKFNEAISFCIFSTANDPMKFPLICINVGNDKIVSCDNYRITEYFLDKEIKDDFLLPLNVAIYLQNYDVNKYLVEDEWTHFKNKHGIIFSFRNVEGDYPETSHLFEIEGNIFTFPKSLIESIEQAEIMGDEEDNIIISINKDEMVCMGRNDMGWIKIKEKIDYKLEPIEFKINSIFLKQILLKNNENVTIGETSLLFENDRFKHVLSLYGE